MRARLAASLVIATGLVLASSGCAYFAPQSTQIMYDPSDGVSGSVGDIEVLNAMAITKDGESVNLVMVVINSGEQSRDVRFAYNFEDATNASNPSETVTIEAGERVSFGNGGDAPDLVLTNANTRLGALMPVFVQYGEETGDTMQVPVLDNALPGYEDLLPTETPVPSSTPEPAA